MGEPIIAQRCECMATAHALFALCLHCGKILCEREKGDGCTACRCLLRGAGGLLGGGGTAAAGATGDAAALADAYAQRDKLLLYDRTSAQRTVVRDDDSDYFAASAAPREDATWLSKEEEALEALREAQARAARASGRRGLRITIDIDERRVVDVAREAAAAQRAVHLEALQETSARAAAAAARGEAAAAAAAAPRGGGALQSSAAFEEAAGGGGVGGGAGGGAATPPPPPQPQQPPSLALGTGKFSNASLKGAGAAIYADLLRDAQEARASAASAKKSKGKLK